MSDSEVFIDSRVGFKDSGSRHGTNVAYAFSRESFRYRDRHQTREQFIPVGLSLGILCNAITFPPSIHLSVCSLLENTYECSLFLP